MLTANHANPVPAIELKDIVRRCGQVLANDRISLRVQRGEVHAIVGENGAGKTTLMKIAYGQLTPDRGEIFIKGSSVRFRSSADALAAGIGMVHQHFMLVPVFTVAENLVLGNEPTRGGIFDAVSARDALSKLADQSGMLLDPDELVENLSVGQQQRLEILKVLYRGAETIILDEPTAVLTPQEVDSLFVTIRKLRDAGKTIILITHKLREVMALSDKVTVLREGRNVASLVTSETTAEEIAHRMVGRDVVLPSLKRVMGEAVSEKEAAAQVAQPQEAVLRVSSLSVGSARRVVNDVSFHLGRGEILGVAGVEGNGQTELVDALTGLIRAAGGSIELDGVDVTSWSPRKRFAAGLACIPEDRHQKGLILGFSLRENLKLGRHRDRAFLRRLRGGGTEELLREHDVRPAAPGAMAASLSGGNQQKLIVAREFTRDAKVVIAAQPTRGIDLGAIEAIHERMLALRSQGAAILLVSAELSEILALSDRIIVMYGGRIVHSTENVGLTEHDLGIYMAGATPAPTQGNT